MTRCARRAAICRIKYELNSVSKQASGSKCQVNIRPKYTFVNRTKTRVLIDKNVVLINIINILINIEQYMMSNSVLTWNLESLTLNLTT